jgi:hypothetical protein
MASALILELKCEARASGAASRPGLSCKWLHVVEGFVAGDVAVPAGRRGYHVVDVFDVVASRRQ